MSRPLHYLATPYSRYFGGREQAYIEACKCAALLIKRGLFVFSPIAHSHPIAEIGGIDPLCADTWLPLDLAMLDECDGLLVVMMPDWDQSEGIKKEIARARELGKPVSFLSWPMLNERENVEGFGDLQPRG